MEGRRSLSTGKGYSRQTAKRVLTALASGYAFQADFVRKTGYGNILAD